MLPGYWMPITGVSASLLFPVLVVYFVLILDIVPHGPAIWDAAQIYFCGVLGTCLAIVSCQN